MNLRTRIRLGATVLLVFAGAGCEFQTDDPAPVVVASPMVPPPAPQTAALPPVPGRRPAPPPAPSVEPAALVGMNQEQAVALLGKPPEVKEQPPSTVWRYGKDDCRLELMFFMDLSTRAFRVLTYKFNPERRSDDAQRRCLSQLRSDVAGR